MAQEQQGFQLSGRAYLMVAIAIFGAANAVTRKITEIGAENLIDGRNPISFCNVLFVGNLCALVLLGILYHRQWTKENLKKISAKSWVAMTFVAVLGAAAVPTMVFTALAITAVNNVILIGQIDTPLVLLLSIFLLGAKVNRWVIFGAALSFLGVSLTVILQPSSPDAMVFMIGRGELLVLIAAVLKAIANLISKISLKEIPLGIFSTFRMIIGTITFFTATTVLYGPHHFMDVATPFLWQWMLGYAAIIVVGGQLFWFSGLKRSTASEVSFATAFNPLVGVLAAYLLLGDAPTTAQYIGGAVILLGICANQIGVQKLNAMKNVPKPTPKELSESITYKGI
ncbi:protein of unknown function DUF6 transmembrane [[Leptolyngbya] sp. PCC 7376]|uniref:DMT family transporter n=1 Tax=[Leptolyngbya] sp. PCC 7376 TaxID=111781 RepID=UPI00029EEE53|nr:DMT family transporter [[Leptolyngbya] sp. PCC 7376]AFY38869.1 protein of unknown function DUF6 transmembrane [[Leptolyngbya] sp. PCC 7376]